MSDNVRILILDDVHLEGRPPEMCSNFLNEINQKIDGIKKQYLIPIVICAGDIGEGTTGIEWAKKIKCEVIYVCGNHEFWSNDYFETLDTIKQLLNKPEYSNIYFLHNTTKILHGIKFIGSTLWTNLGKDWNWTNKNYIIKYYSVIGDFKKITAKNWYTTENIEKLKALLLQNGVEDTKITELISNKLFNPLIELEENEKAVTFLNSEFLNKYEGKTMVVTHHLPFKDVWVNHFNIQSQDLSKSFINNEKNFLDAAKGSLSSSKDLLAMGFYTNDLKSIISTVNAPEYWIHGHLHQPIDDWVGKTKVLSNPIGYFKQSKELNVKEIILEDGKKEISQFVKKEIENFSWNKKILDNLRAFEGTILKYADIVTSGIATSENFEPIAKAFIQNHEYAIKEINQQIIQWMSRYYYHQFPTNCSMELNEDMKDDVGLTLFLNKQLDKRNKKIFSLSIAVNAHSFTTEEKFNELNKNGLQVYHYKYWLKELTQAQLNVTMYKKILIEFCNTYKR